MASATFLEAPADRPAGQRGWRAWAACAVAVAAIVVIAISKVSEGTGATHVAHLVAAATLISAAALVWTARRRHVLMLAVGLTAAAIGAVVVAGIPNRHRGQLSNGRGEATYVYDPGGSAVTRAEVEAVPKGSTEDAVTEILGSEAGTAEWRGRDGRDMDCLLYRDRASRGPSAYRFAFCFAGDRYVSLQRW
jgi:hypothetical protein